MKINKMKLELKHLAPYLPYGLNIKIIDNIRNYKVGQIRELKVQLFWDFSKSERDIIKPILRPLSDLTTSHNIFEDKAICFIDESDNGGSFTIDDIYFKYKESSFSDWRNAYLLLLENHFDVFGLIEKGLAININDL
jgi:hypothetical protein